MFKDNRRLNSSNDSVSFLLISSIFLFNWSLEEKISKGREQLQRAEEIALIARNTLPNVIESRDLARNTGAALLQEEYSEVEEQFIELTKAIEKNNLSWALSNEARISKAFNKLRLRAVFMKLWKNVDNDNRALDKPIKK